MKHIAYLILLTTIGFIATMKTYSQATVILQPLAADAKDAEIWSLEPTTNFGDYPELKANAWTWSGLNGIQRALLYFDLSSIPADAVIVSAQLSLYAEDSPDTQFHSGDNDSWLKRITSPWEEFSVTWNTQPSTTSIHQADLPQSIAPYQDYLNINVKNLVKDMINDPGGNFGFMLQLQNESPYRRLTFRSSDQDEPSENPKLVIIYSDEPIDNGCSFSLILKPGPEKGVDAEIWSLEPTTNFGDYPEIKANAWTWDGTPGTQRGLFDFDLSALPLDAVIDHASLSLYSEGSPSTQYHSGGNRSVIQRITSPWEEETVTWATQPSITMVNQVLLPTSTSPYQDYVNINVTNLVTDMINNPADSYGFMIRLVKEKRYRRMTFASSDSEIASKHPALKICYHIDSAKLANFLPGQQLLVYPNPFTNIISFTSPETNKGLTIKLYDLSGRQMMEKYYPLSNYITIDLSNLNSQQAYILYVQSDEKLYKQIIIKS